MHYSNYGFGETLLAKMGYVPGKGLGVNLQGIPEPIEVDLRPKGIGIGANLDDEHSDTESGTSSDEEADDLAVQNKGLSATLSKVEKHGFEVPETWQELASEELGLMLDKLNRTKALREKQKAVFNGIFFVKGETTNTRQEEVSRCETLKAILNEFSHALEQHLSEVHELKQAKELVDKEHKDLGQIEKLALALIDLVDQFLHSEPLEFFLDNSDTLLSIVPNLKALLEFNDFEPVRFLNDMLIFLLQKDLETLINTLWAPQDSANFQEKFSILQEEFVAKKQRTSGFFVSDSESELSVFDSILIESFYPSLLAYFEAWPQVGISEIQNLEMLNVFENCREFMHWKLMNYLSCSVIKTNLLSEINRRSTSAIPTLDAWKLSLEPEVWNDVYGALKQRVIDDLKALDLEDLMQMNELHYFADDRSFVQQVLVTVLSKLLSQFSNRVLITFEKIDTMVLQCFERLKHIWALGNPKNIFEFVVGDFCLNSQMMLQSSNLVGKGDWFEKLYKTLKELALKIDQNCLVALNSKFIPILRSINNYQSGNAYHYPTNSIDCLELIQKNANFFVDSKETAKPVRFETTLPSFQEIVEEECRACNLLLVTTSKVENRFGHVLYTINDPATKQSWSCYIDDDVLFLQNGNESDFNPVSVGDLKGLTVAV